MTSGRKISGGMSVSELLSALTQAQKEREAAMDELKTISEGERNKAELSEHKAARLQEELEETRRRTADLNLQCQELENTLKAERENYGRIKQKEEDELRVKLEKWKDKLETLSRNNQDLERSNSHLSDELEVAKNKIRKILASEDQLKDEIKQLRDNLETSKTALDKATKSNEISESELHITKMQLLKENNINNRLLDELKRTRKEIDDYKDEINRLKKSKENYKNNVSQQIKELSILLTENNKENFNDDLREIRLGLTTVLKENFVLNSKIEDVYKYLTKTDPEQISAATQTAIGFDQMYSYENMDREVSNLVMRLREELVTSKSDILELKQQNQNLKLLLADLRKEKQIQETVEDEENRVEKLEYAVKSLKQLLQRNERGEAERDVFSAIEHLRRDVDYLKNSNLLHKPEGNDLPFIMRPSKLITTRK